MKYSSYDSGFIQSGHSFDRNTLLPPKKRTPSKKKKKRTRSSSPEASPHLSPGKHHEDLPRKKFKKQTKAVLKAENTELKASLA
eukprot:CAMPEP_0170508508 /NCGR_PEP_ID=MMETSP0208-20121228/62558_1 /TAXON_ID=197538 /ORGANISM="Strombidium inclinatum, Strain S3" /LENGTH=83 /DNA_ID=CAMNT_0010791445 /DNA_START=208 /DNA_END=459 /DNA_ORIENTATION=-